ncbi:MAG: glycogen/starch/alpha-glucan phosphorylase [Candidatus Omnitrophota bacterium]
MGEKHSKGKQTVAGRKKTIESLKHDFLHNRKYALAKDHYSATDYDNFQSLAMTIRDRLIERWMLTQQRYHDENRKRVYYLSLEFLLGRLLDSNIINLGLLEESKKAVAAMGLSLENLSEEEVDAGLGNGGLGRLAACFLDSMATLGIAASGYGIRYDYGIFKQKIVNGYQVEFPEEWLKLGNPWEFERPEYMVKVKFYGRTVDYVDKRGKLCVDWANTKDVLAVAYDIPVPGYKNDVVNNLRLWSARSAEEFDLDYFHDGDYIKACQDKIISENISRVLYPSDDVFKGLELRLKQEYFFTCASIHDIVRRFKMHNDDFRTFPDKVVIQLNDTHPAVAIVELLRVLIDEEELDWALAWDITARTFAYTNHTTMPEALEKWPASLFGELLPRHLELVYEINMRFLRDVANHYPHDHDRLSRMSLVEEGADKKIRMSHLCIVGSFSVNGVSELHTELLKKDLFRDFYEMYPEKFNSKTNGITQRRWLNKANPGLADIITGAIGNGWTTELDELKKLQGLVSDTAFKKKWRDVKKENKISLAKYIEEKNGVIVDPKSIFDVQVKRIHEYKRQILFAFYLISQYLKIKNAPNADHYPRTAIIAGKAAPSYDMAKMVIKFVNNIAGVINKDPAVNDKLKVVFLENYCVSLAEKIFPASDLSEQISTAGREASGTGNMKFMLNGAVTIGTWDGANIEIAKEVGDDNIFIFGLKENEINELKKKGYNPREYIKKNALLEEIFELVREDFFSQIEPGIFKGIHDSLFDHDEYMVCADFADYIAAQDRATEAYRDRDGWVKKSIINVANSGRFSSDRTVREYARDIWKV